MDSRLAPDQFAPATSDQVAPGSPVQGLAETDRATGAQRFPLNRRPWAGKTLLWAFGLVLTVLAKLWLVAGQTRQAVGFALADDALFVKLAGFMTQGRWMGPYNDMTLVKGPGYPMLLAFNYALGIPLHRTEHILYALACALFIPALRPLLPSRSLRTGLFLLLLFHPMSFAVQTLRFIREPLFVAQTLSVLAAALGLLARLPDRRLPVLPWAAGLGGLLAFFWVTREESLWILPSLALVFLFALIQCGKTGLARWLASLGCTAGLAWAGVFAVTSLHALHYGTRDLSEFTSPPFRAACAALMRIEPQPLQHWVPVPAEVRQRAYRVSPTFRQLKPFLEGELGQKWVETGRQYMPHLESARTEILGGWFIWAIRDAAAAAGMHGSAAQAADFYGRMAEEVNAACDSGQLRAGPRSDSPLPPWRNDYLVPLLQSMGRGLAELTFLHSFWAISPPSAGTEAQIRPFALLSHDRITPTSMVPLQQRPPWDVRRLRLLVGLGELYKLLVPLLCGTAGLTLLLALRPAWRRRTRALPATLVLATACLTRLTLLSYIEVTYFPGLSIQYILPLYSLLMLCSALVIADAWATLRAGIPRLV